MCAADVVKNNSLLKVTWSSTRLVAAILRSRWQHRPPGHKFLPQPNSHPNLGRGCMAWSGNATLGQTCCLDLSTKLQSTLDISQGIDLRQSSVHFDSDSAALCKIRWEVVGAWCAQRMFYSLIRNLFQAAGNVVFSQIGSTGQIFTPRVPQMLRCNHTCSWYSEFDPYPCWYGVLAPH